MYTNLVVEIHRVRWLRNGALGMAAFLLLMTPWRLSGGPGPGAAGWPALHSALSATLLLICAWALHGARHRIRSAEGPALGLMMAGLGITLSQMWIYHRIQESACTLVISVASGVVLRKRGSLLLFQGLLLGLWMILAVHVAGPVSMASWVFDLVLAGLLAFLIRHLLERHTRTLVRRIQRQRALIRTNAALMAEVQESLQNIRTLNGLIPICAHCKKIRNDQGYWEQVESYLRAHTEAQFSHGVCPECARTLLDEFKRPEPHE
jgi:hypothetical protein